MKTSDEIISRFDIMEWVETKKPEPEWVERLAKVLLGIDTTEVEDKNGWWETSSGAAYGEDKKKDIYAFIRHEVLEKFIDDLKSSSADGERMRCVGFSDIDAVLKRWMGGI